MANDLAEINRRMDEKIMALLQEIEGIAKLKAGNPVELSLNFMFGTLGAIRRISDLSRGMMQEYNKQVFDKLAQSAQEQMRRDLAKQRKKMLEEQEKKDQAR